MKRNSLSVSMDQAIKAWTLRHPTTDSTSAQITAHAVAHGVSVSGLWRALLQAGYVTRKPKASPDASAEATG